VFRINTQNIFNNQHISMYSQGKHFPFLLKSLKFLAFIPLIAILAAGLGFGYERISRSNNAKQYPVQGKLIDIGNGRKLQIDCRGISKDNSPTVILESGFDYYGSLSWYKVQDEIAKTTQVCSYSRAGIMWSDPDPREYTADNIASDLNLLLQKSNITTPVVIVGHSLAGPLIMKFVQLYPNQVKGLVFVDTSHPDEIEKGKAINKELNLPTTEEKAPPQFLVDLANEIGVLRIIKLEQNAKDLLPEQFVSLADAYTSTTLPTILKGSNNIEKLITSSGDFRNLGDIPTIQLASAKVYTATDDELKKGGWTREKLDSFNQKNQEFKDTLGAERNTWSTNSKYVKVPDAEHYIHLDNPSIVIKSVIEVLESVKTGNKLQ
jgi:pimeloyl-ACP methyl ester carboxylesterase